MLSCGYVRLLTGEFTYRLVHARILLGCPGTLSAVSGPRTRCGPQYRRRGQQSSLALSSLCGHFTRGVICRGGATNRPPIRRARERIRTSNLSLLKRTPLPLGYTGERVHRGGVRADSQPPCFREHSDPRIPLSRCACDSCPREDSNLHCHGPQPCPSTKIGVRGRTFLRDPDRIRTGDLRPDKALRYRCATGPNAGLGAGYASPAQPLTADSSGASPRCRAAWLRQAADGPLTRGLTLRVFWCLSTIPGAIQVARSEGIEPPVSRSVAGRSIR